MNTTIKKEEIVDYRKCFANPENFPADKITNCTALIEPLCKTTGECPFYKTKGQLKIEQQKTKVRLAQLGLEELLN